MNIVCGYYRIMDRLILPLGWAGLMDGQSIVMVGKWMRFVMH